MKSKAEHAAYMKEWGAKNADTVNAKRRARREADKEAINAKRKVWSAARSDEAKTKEAARKKAWAAAHKEQVRTARKEYVKRVGRYWAHIKHKFGVTREEWLELFAAQGEQCAVCGAKETDSKRFWAIDHCHTTSTTRGILCMQCNIMLGAAKDDPSILIAGAEYLKSHR
jgi:hypothetical protein